MRPALTQEDIKQAIAACEAKAVRNECAIGVSRLQSDEDEQIAMAGAKAITG